MRKFRERKLNRNRRGDEPKKGRGILKAFVSICIVLLIGLLMYLIYSLVLNLYENKIKCSACNSKNGIILKRQDITTSLIVIGSPVSNKLTGAWLIVEKRNSPSVTVFYIPPGVSVGDYTGSFNTFIQVSDLEYAGSLLNQKRAREYSIWQIENMTGFTLQNYIWLNSNALDSYAKMFGDIGESAHVEYSQEYENASEVSQSSTLINSMFDNFGFLKLIGKSNEWAVFLKNLDTNMSSSDIPFFFMHMRNVFDAGNHTMIDLSQRDALNEIQNDSGRPIETINYVEYDRKIEQIFSNIRPRDIEKEQARVEVYNGSEIAGLASRYARKVQNFGINVVRYDNAPDSVDKTTIYISDEKRFKNSFEGVEKVVCSKCNIIQGRPQFITTGDIVVILGKEKIDEISWR